MATKNGKLGTFLSISTYFADNERQAKDNNLRSKSIF